MIHVLIVDDVDAKAQQVEQLVRDILGESVEIARVSSLMDLRAQIGSHFFDIVILDLNLPRYSGDEPEPGLGKTIFDWFAFTPGDIRRPGYIVGLTAFEEIERELSLVFTDENCFLLRYTTYTSEWRDRLARLLAHATAVSTDSDDNDYDYDLGIVVALSHVELEAVRNLSANWIEKRVKGDDVLYFESEVPRDGKSPLRIVVAAAAKMGMPASTALAMQMIHSCRPRNLAMTGIAAGIKGRFGDILIAEQAWDYGSGKIKLSRFGRKYFEPAPEPIPIDRGIRAKLAEFRTRRLVLNEIHNGWTGAKPVQLDTQIGAFASGAAVIEDRGLAAQLIAGQRKLIAIEMEVYGLFEASVVCSSPRPNVFAVKSICDFANRKKDDDFQAYAAYTSAEFVFRFACEYL